ncbi:MAG: sigma-54-dependent Fis family transcriptional regulator [Desulfobacteraceae bacterium]|nr:sigma-54-dependent Fis family transcriptional regulator [Desulfobacteraceae bacterium]
MMKRILVVDDEESLCFTFERFLKNEGYDVSCARNFMDAKDEISKKDFDLVIADQILEDKSGSEILHHIKNLGLNVPVVMITGNPDLDIAASALKFGAYDYLSKPVKKDILLNVAREALNHKFISDLNLSIEKEREIYRHNLEAVFRTVKDGIITVDESLNITEANDSVNLICGFGIQKIKGKSIYDAFSSCSGQCADIIGRAVNGKTEILEKKITCTRKDRPEQVVLVSGVPLKNNKGGLLVVRDITKVSRLEKELRKKNSNLMVGKSQSLKNVFELIETLKDLDTAVLVTGETGTGKELAAKALHFEGSRSSHPFVAINCSAISMNLLESELFGHVKGAFTGALMDKKGKFLLADKGTLFLDEIGDIPEEIQLKLLRFLQEKEFEPVGGNETIKVDVRIVAATNKNLLARINRNKFRKDLYYRLNVVNIEMPPLRKRIDDIPLLFEHFKNIFNKKMDKNIKTLSFEVFELFSRYQWPGNIRELEHCLEHAFVMCRGDEIFPDHLPSEIRSFAKEDLEECSDERQLIINALEKSGYNKARAARLLDISRQTLYRKLNEYMIQCK